MTGELTVWSLLRPGSVNLALLRRIARCLLAELLCARDFELGLYLVGPAEMTRLNEAFLRHKGPTDVIAFNYGEPFIQPSYHASPRRVTGRGPSRLWGEIFVCPDQAMRQACRFHTTWQSEVVRYAVHGVLHLMGYDDLRPEARKLMKREEDRLLRQLARRYPIEKLARSAALLGRR